MVTESKIEIFSFQLQTLIKKNEISLAEVIQALAMIEVRIIEQKKQIQTKGIEDNAL